MREYMASIDSWRAVRNTPKPTECNHTQIETKSLVIMTSILARSAWEEVNTFLTMEDAERRETQGAADSRPNVHRASNEAADRELCARL